VRRRLLWGLILAVIPGPAAADTCGPADGIEAALPADGSVRVPVNSRVRVRYPLGEDVVEQPLEVTADGEPVEGITCPLDESCPGSASQGARELRFEPALARLPSNATIEVTAGRPGTDFTWSFETGDARDTEPPEAQPIERARWEWLGDGADDDPCGPGDDLVRYQISLFVPPAYDAEVSRENVEYLVFRTNGPDVDDPILEGISLDDGDGSLVEARVYLPAEEKYARTICFSVAAVDVAGNSSGQFEDCMRLEEGPFFRSCSTSPGSSGTTWTTFAGGIVLVAAMTWGRRRSRK